jgi:DnaJ-class molecular chaperone
MISRPGAPGAKCGTCNGRGMVERTYEDDDVSRWWEVGCDDCCWTGRDTIPWEELFPRLRREWLPEDV